MKLILRLVKAARRANVRQHIKYFILYSLCALFLTAELLVGYSYIISFDNEISATYGDQDVTMADNEAFGEKLRLDSRVESFATSASYFVTPDRVSVGTLSAGAVDIQNITLVCGNLPIADNEIAIEKTILSLLYNGAAIGDTIVIDGQYSFTLCGIINDYSQLQWEVSTNSFIMPNAIVTEAAATQAFSNPIVTFYMATLQDGIYPGDYVYEQRVNKTVMSICENQAMTSQLASQYLNNKNMILPAVMLVGLLLMVSALIYITSVSNRQNLSKMAELKIVGMDNRSIKTYFMLQNLDRSALAGIIGGILGVVAGSVIISILPELSVHYNLWLLLAGLLIALVIPPMLSVISMHRYYKMPVVELMRPTPKYNDSIRRSKYLRSNDPVVICAARNYYGNGSRGATFRILMFLSIAVVAVTLFLSAYSLAQAQKNESAGDISLKQGVLWMMDRDGYVCAEPFKGIAENKYQLIKSSPSASRVVGVKYFQVFTAQDASSVKADEQWPYSEQYKADYGFPADVCIGPQRIYGIDLDILELLSPYIERGDNSLDLLTDSKHVLYIHRYEGDSPYNVGDNIRFMQYIPGEEPYMADFSAQVVGVLNYLQIPDDMSDVKQGLASGFLWTNDCFDMVGLPLSYLAIYITVKDPSDTADIDKLVSDIKYTDSQGIIIRTNLQDKLARVEQGRIISAAGYAVCGILVLFSVLCLSITLNVKIYKRRSALGVLRAIGMSQKQQYLSLLFETWFDVLYVGGVAIIASIIMCALYAARMITLSILEVEGAVPKGVLADFSLSGFPWLALILIVALYLVASAIVCFVPIRKFYKESNVECIRFE